MRNSFVISMGLVALLGCGIEKPDTSFTIEERKEKETLNFETAATIPSSHNYFLYVGRLNYVLQKKMYGSLYDNFSPASVRVKLTKSQFLESTSKIFPETKRLHFVEALTLLLADKQSVPTKLTASYRSYKIKLKSETLTFISRSEKGTWVLAELKYLED